MILGNTSNPIHPNSKSLEFISNRTNAVGGRQQERSSSFRRKEEPENWKNSKNKNKNRDREQETGNRTPRPSRVRLQHLNGD
jgi:hypothetical protein